MPYSRWSECQLLSDFKLWYVLEEAKRCSNFGSFENCILYDEIPVPTIRGNLSLKVQEFFLLRECDRERWDDEYREKLLRELEGTADDEETDDVNWIKGVYMFGERVTMRKDYPARTYNTEKTELEFFYDTKDGVLGGYDLVSSLPGFSSWYKRTGIKKTTVPLIQKDYFLAFRKN